MDNSEMVLFISGRETNYPRNSVFKKSLESFVDLKVIGPTKEEVSKGSYIKILLSSVIGFIKAFPGIITGKYEVIFIGFFGQFLVLPIRLFTKKPIFFDLFVSSYDTMVNDRKKIKKGSFLAKLLLKLDFYCCHFADTIFVDTNSNREFYKKLFDINPEKMVVLFVGCDENVFYPSDKSVDENLVLYYSSFMPLHGVDTIIKAANILKNTTPLKFRIIGEGQETDKIYGLVKKLDVHNVTIQPSQPLTDLPNLITTASICLGGHFGDTEKAKRVIPGKTFQLLAMKKATIVGDNKANRELMTHKKDAWFCEMNNPEALADAILFLYENPSIREQIAEGGRRTFLENASNNKLRGEIFQTYKKRRTQH
jgi:glycosyltransferase involved in cell wall biosynthesis